MSHDHADAITDCALDYLAAVSAARESVGHTAAATLADAEAVVAARVRLFTRLTELGWTPPEQVLRAMEADQRLLEHGTGSVGG